MKKIIAPALALMFLAAGCSSVSEDAVKPEVSVTVAKTKDAVTVPADAKWDAPNLIEVPSAVEAEEIPAAVAAPAAPAAPPVHTNAATVDAVIAENVTPEVTDTVVPEVIYEEAVPMPCLRDMPCYVPLTPQEWVHQVTGDYSLVIHTWEGVLPNGCDTLAAAICAVDNTPDDDSVSYYMSQTKSEQAGYVPEIMEVIYG